MDVDLRQLRVLAAVEEERSFTAAADRLGMSQASVSRAIAALELAVGRPLLHRTTRRVEPTDAGAALAGVGRRVLAELEQAVAGLRGEPSVLRLGYAWAALGAQTTPFLRDWNRTHPREPIRLSRINRRDAGLADGRVDLAVVRGPVGVELESEVVAAEPRVVALAVDHALADRGVLELADLVPYPIGVDRFTGTTTTALWTDRGLDAPAIVDTADIEEWLDLIAAGDAIGVTALGTEQQTPRPGVVFARLADAPPIEVRVAWRRGHPHPAAARLARAIRAAYAGGLG